MKVAIYLRVSTIDQATRGNAHREGFSIPAQREACRIKAKTLNATVIREYADRGESARSTARPELQRLLSDLCKKNSFDYVIVHKIDRLARSLHDDVMICLAIKKSGAKLVSVTENIDDETPSGGLLHGIMAAIAEFYSRNLAAEALKGATEKAKQGGTPFQAPLGYVNIIERINHRENRSIILDTERVPLIRWGFERYATGDYSQLRICQELAKRGLRSRARARSRVEPLSLSGLDRMLSNRYYIGYVTYCGIEYKGKHQPIITPAVFAAVQAVRKNHYNRHCKNRTHFHYLSRFIVCGNCKRHLCFSVAKGKYGYFFCMNRSVTNCTQPYIPALSIEKAITKTLTELKFSENDRGKLSKQIEKELIGERHFAANEVNQQKQRLNRLEVERENLLQVYYDKLIEPGLLKSEQKRINKEIGQAQIVIQESEERLSVVNSRKDRAMELANGLDIGKVYSKANPVIKRHFCQALFSDVVVNDRVIVHRGFGGSREHMTSVVKVNWHNPINIHQLTEGILALSLERNSK